MGNQSGTVKQPHRHVRNPLHSTAPERKSHGRDGRWAILPALLLAGALTPVFGAGGPPPPARPGDLKSYFTQADQWLRRREPDRAFSVLRRAASDFPKDARAHSTLAALLTRRGSQAEAARQYQLAANLQPRNPAPLFGLAQAEYAQGRLPQAEAALGRVIRLDPMSSPAYARLGMIQMERFATEKALASCRRALELDPANAEAHFYLAESLRRVRRLDEAEPHARQALAGAPENARIYVTLGRIYLERVDTPGNREEALAAFRRAISLEPGRAEAHYSLGLLQQRAQNWPEAEKSLREAIRLQPGMAAAYYTLSLVERRLGKTREAEAHLARFQHLRESGAALGRSANASMGGGR